MRRILSLFLLLSVLFSLTACGSSAPAAPQEPPAVSQTESETTENTPEDSAESQPEITPEPYSIYDPTVMPEGGVRDGVNYVAYNGVVEHLFFHPVIAYPEQAFDGDHMSDGYDDWMVTVGEYNKILQSVYEKGFVLVDISDCWSAVLAVLSATVRIIKTRCTRRSPAHTTSIQRAMPLFT